MNAANAANVPAGRTDSEVTTTSPVQPGDDLGAFLGTLATQLRDTLARFNHTADKVSEMVTSLPGQAGRDLIVVLQDFDRLQQEFAALGDVLARTGASANIVWPGGKGIDELKRELVSEISIADLRERILLQLEAPALEELTLPEDQIEAEF